MIIYWSVRCRQNKTLSALFSSIGLWLLSCSQALCMQLCTVPVQWKALLYISMKLSAKAAIKNNCIVLMMASRSLRPWCHCWRPSRSSYVPWWSWYMYYWDVCRCQSWAPASWFAQTHHRIIDAKEKKTDTWRGVGNWWKMTARRRGRGLCNCASVLLKI